MLGNLVTGWTDAAGGLIRENAKNGIAHLTTDAQFAGHIVMMLSIGARDREIPGPIAQSEERLEADPSH